MRFYTNRDLALMSAAAAVSGVAYTGLGQLWLALSSAFGPLGGAALGLFQFGHIIAFGLIRKPGVAFITSVLSTIVQALIGDPTGILVIGWGITHGIGCEIVLASWRYKNAKWFSLMTAAGIGAVSGHMFSYVLYGWEDALWMFYISIPIVFLASSLESGGLAYWITKVVERAKLV